MRRDVSKGSYGSGCFQMVYSGAIGWALSFAYAIQPSGMLVGEGYCSLWRFELSFLNHSYLFGLVFVFCRIEFLGSLCVMGDLALAFAKLLCLAGGLF